MAFLPLLGMILGILGASIGILLRQREKGIPIIRRKVVTPKTKPPDTPETTATPMQPLPSGVMPTWLKITGALTFILVALGLSVYSLIWGDEGSKKWATGTMGFIGGVFLREVWK